MKKIAIIFSHAPYGNSLGQEGLDVALSASCFTKDIGLFFIEDGIFQIFKHQNPEKILLKNYSVAFGILSLCNIHDIYVCYDSMQERGFTRNIDFILQVHVLSIKNIKNKITEFDCILKF